MRGGLDRFRRWYRRSDLGRHTAVLAALVAAISLAVTAWGTYKSAQVADDQLRQSRDEDAKDKQAQASRVNGWVEGREFVAANRSLDPTVMWVFLTSAERRASGSNLVTYVYLGVMPPCTAVRMPQRVVNTRAADLAKPRGTGWIPKGLHFTTSDGTRWVRWGDGRLMETSSEPAHRRPGDVGLINNKQAKVSRLDECGSMA
ncbi:hypothetical protein [Streptomyces sp. NPDC058240]|uniref:hypothetical protein n=1 Tax=Streptomyces sp. NPDC058240 TaxID=3346396 RepID=UPI0036F0CE6E